MRSSGFVLLSILVLMALISAIWVVEMDRFHRAIATMVLSDRAWQVDRVLQRALLEVQSQGIMSQTNRPCLSESQVIKRWTTHNMLFSLSVRCLIVFPKTQHRYGHNLHQWRLIARQGGITRQVVI